MVRKILCSLLIFCLMISTGEAANLSGKTEIKDLRYSLGSGTLRIVLDVPQQVDFRESYAENPSRLIVSLKNTWIDVKKMKLDIELVSTVAKRIKVAQFDDSTVRVVVETMADVKIFWLNGGPAGKRLVIDIGNAAFKPNDELNKQQQKSESDTDKKSDKKTDKKDKDKKSDKKDEDKSDSDKKSDKKDKDKSDTEIDISGGDEVDTPFSHKKSDKDKKSDKKEKKSYTERKAEKDKKEKDKKSDKKDKKDKKDNKKQKKDEVEEPFQELEDELEQILTLEGKVIVIDPGHGGGDAGAIGPTGVMEKSVTLRVALKLEEMLEEAGAEVIMTRTTDRQVSHKGDRASAIEELQARCDVANQVKADIFISIHADSFTNPAARGSTGYYYSKTEGQSAIRLADAIRRGVCEQLRTPSRGTKPCDFYVVRHTDMAATLVELAFISNPDEEKLLDSDEGIEKAAQGIFDGIEDYFG